MTLAVGRLVTHCRVGRARGAEAATLVDREGRERLPAELGAQLRPSLDRQAPIVRLRRLDLTVRISAMELAGGRLAGLWALTFARSLHAALARPDGDGSMLRRFADPAAYAAAEIAALLEESPPPRWVFPRDGQGQPRAAAVLAVLLDAGPRMADVLAALAAGGKLERMLALLDEVALERLLRHAAATEPAQAEPGAAHLGLVGAGLADAREAPARGEGASRRQAIRLWFRLGMPTPPRATWHAIRLMLVLLENPGLLDPCENGLLPPSLPAWCDRARKAIARGDAEAATAAEALDRLRTLTPTAVIPKAGGRTLPRWLETDTAGMLLLYATIRELGWARLLRAPEAGPRVLQALIAGTGMRLLGDWQFGDPVAPAVALLSGVEAEADRHAIAAALSGRAPASLLVLPDAEDLPEALDAAAALWARRFASSIRSFRDAKREAVVRQFLRIPGRTLLEDEELRVVIAPSPWAVALHLSGADRTLEHVEWLGLRRVSFVLEGL